MVDHVPETNTTIVSRENEPLLGNSLGTTQRGDRIAPNLITGTSALQTY